MRDGVKMPHANGLGEDLTGLEIKKYCEAVQNRKDKYKANRFLSTHGYIVIEHGPGHVYDGTDMFETRGYKFQGSS